MLKVSAPELVSGVSGESEQKLRELFDLAVVSSAFLIFYHSRPAFPKIPFFFFFTPLHPFKGNFVLSRSPLSLSTIASSKGLMV